MLVEEPAPLTLLVGTKALLPTSRDLEVYLLVFLKISTSCSEGYYPPNEARLIASVDDKVY